ncbi:hypothetical protein BGY98DRAFT_954639 [Russula aff. rugulosa BPL654]|nr:hypothetical protein BGY98DRAFT_954639 [Russula aff. rugulosa BPL654]
MRFSLASAAALSALFLPVLVNAQPRPSLPATRHTSVLISPGLYTPQSFTAKKGTYVTFYYPVLTELHSATQGSFDDPCVYLDKKHEKGFDSGAQSGTQFTIKITDDKNVSRHLVTSFPWGSGPLWHRRNGWVSALSNSYISFLDVVYGRCFFFSFRSAINAPATGDRSFAAYLAASKALGTSAINETYTGYVLGGVDAKAKYPPS